jgi:PilZ domain
MSEREESTGISIILALVTDSESASAARASGANFAIQRTSNLHNDLERSLQSAYGLIWRERRRYERHPVDVSVDFPCNGRMATGRIIDISEGGACPECDFEFAAQPIRLGFSLPGLKQPLRIEGVATWKRGSKLGIHFTHLLTRRKQPSPSGYGSKSNYHHAAIESQHSD